MMDTLSEVIDYCNLDKPAGALLLTGEWGSGKTYLVDHKLQETLKDTHLFLRVSMFGISDTEVLKKAVLTKWLQTIGPESDRVRKAKQIVRRAGNGVKSVLPDTGPALELLNSLLDIDLLLFFPLKNEYKEKKVVLVFDDFERADIKPQNILGVINDYCENQHFHVIIVTYEGKIRHVSEPKRADEASGELLYKEIKEKCVQRTLKLVPDYDEIVPSVFEDMASGDYRTFLQEQSTGIRSIFSGVNEDGSSFDAFDEGWESDYFNSVAHNEKEREKQTENKRLLRERRPHNIRLLKAALQDFGRIHGLLISSVYHENIEKVLYSFLCFFFSFRSGLVERHDAYGWIPGDQDIQILYPGFYDPHYLPDSVRKWVENGMLDEEVLIEEASRVCVSEEQISPSELIKKTTIQYLDEEVIDTGMPLVLDMAYQGELTLDEYVMLLYDSRIAREIQYPLTIDWGQMKAGIRKSIDNMVRQGASPAHNVISISDLEKYTEEEAAAYSIIYDFYKAETLTFENNRGMYITLMAASPVEAFQYCKDKRFRAFDREMAQATVEAFKNVGNYDKSSFPNWFEGIWKPYRMTNDMRAEDWAETFCGLQQLSKGLQELEEFYQEQAIARWHTRKFRYTVESLIMEYRDSTDCNKNGNEMG